MKRDWWHFWIFMGVLFCLWSLRATWFYSRVDLAIPDGLWRGAFSNALKFSVWVLPAGLYLAWHDRRRPLVGLKATSRIDRSGLLVGAGVSLGYFACSLLFAYFISGQTLAPLFTAAPMIILGRLAGLFVSPILEELFFRGFVLNKLQANLRFWPANLLQALLFAAIHWPNWLWLEGFHWSLLATSAGILLLGLLAGWLTRRTNSIWPACAVHILNNFLAAFLG